MPERMKVIAGWLLGVAISLLLVGIVSGTLFRHIVQISPAAVVAVLVRRRASWAQYAALPLFVFWLLIMTLIWLYLLGIARIVTGVFSVTEIVLTVVIGICSAAGIVASMRLGGALGWPIRIMAFVLSAASQIGAMWVSMQPWLAHR